MPVSSEQFTCCIYHVLITRFLGDNVSEWLAILRQVTKDH